MGQMFASTNFCGGSKHLSEASIYSLGTPANWKSSKRFNFPYSFLFVPLYRGIDVFEV